jgi:hypothetical protein
MIGAGITVGTTVFTPAVGIETVFESKIRAVGPGDNRLTVIGEAPGFGATLQLIRQLIRIGSAPFFERFPINLVVILFKPVSCLEMGTPPLGPMEVVHEAFNRTLFRITQVPVRTELKRAVGCSLFVFGLKTKKGRSKPPSLSSFEEESRLDSHQAGE